MTPLESTIDSYRLSRDLGKLDDLLIRARAALSPCGTRMVEVKGYTGAYVLDKLAEKVIQASQTILEKKAPLIDAIRLNRAVLKLYTQSDQQLEIELDFNDADFFKKLLVKICVAIREFFCRNKSEEVGAMLKQLLSEPQNSPTYLLRRRASI